MDSCVRKGRSMSILGLPVSHILFVIGDDAGTRQAGVKGRHRTRSQKGEGEMAEQLRYLLLFWRN